MSEQLDILVVDDEPSARELLLDILKAEGYDVQTAGGGELALQSVQAKPPKLILMDINMPGMGGIEAGRHLRESDESRNIPIIFVSGTRIRREKLDGFAIGGAIDFIAKPFQRDELLARIHVHLELHRLRTGLETMVVERTAALRQSETRYQDIFDRAIEGLYRMSPERQFTIVNKAFADILGFGSPEELLADNLYVAEQLRFRPEEQAIMAKKLEDIGIVKGYEIHFRKRDGSNTWLLFNIQTVKNDAGRLLYYEGAVVDISLQKQIENERCENLQRTRQALGATIQAIVMIAETRDPYTAGHQRRVADLARAIATRMGCNANQIDGIRVAGMIHDIGKIAIPAEILSKPTPLTDLEYSLIKVHPQAGYDIMKQIDFPWPIARIIYEHQERIDGSGYPHGLTGDKLLIESRIIAVADVVEAVASHRPYRPGHGIEAALEEIAKQQGKLYDSAVVDACLKLFCNDGYKLPVV